MGKNILKHLEKKAFEKGIETIILDATLLSIDFYLYLGYNKIKNDIFYIQDKIKCEFCKMKKNLLLNK
ncbi:MAG: hypothetical protein ACTSRI_12590 [Promethearchaeota archaeon]